MAVIACLLAAIAPLRAHAQKAVVGAVDGVRDIAQRTGCKRNYALIAAPGSIRLIRRGASAAVKPIAPVIREDRLRVRRFTDLRFRVDSQIGRGNFFLSPDVGRCAQAASALRGLGIEIDSGDGSYELSSNLEQTGRRQVERLVLTIEAGAATIEWAGGPLTVIALGREIQHVGTVFTVLVDSARERALLYVREGTVTMAGDPAVRVTERSAFVFGRSGVPQPVTLSADVRDDITYHSSTVWTQRYKPGFPYWKVLGGTALVTGAAYFILRQTGPSKSGPFEGNINVQLPL